MIPHNMTLFKFICVQYQFHRQILPIMKIQFRDYVSTGTEPKLDRKQDLNDFWQVFFSGQSEKQDGRPDLWLA